MSQVNYRTPSLPQTTNSHPQTQNKVSISPPTTGITNVGTVPHFANNNGKQHLAAKNSGININKKLDKKKKKDKKLLKEDIGNPTNFK